jgi:ABC-2 type transport system permease protein
MGNSIRNISAIAGKELRTYFGSPVAWVLMGFFAIMFGFFFVRFLAFFVQQGMGGQFGGPPPPTNVNNDMIRPLLQNASVLLLFMLPMVTMRAFSEEKRSGTIELLLTSPLTDAEIMLGKFFGAIGAYLGLLAVTAIYIAVLFALGSPALKPILSGYLGLFLLGACFISIGLFVSSTTKNQVVAAGVTFAVLLMFWIINWAADSSGPTMAAVLNYLSVTQHFEDFGKGVIDTKHLVYYLSFIAFGLFLTLKSVDSERWRG